MSYEETHGCCGALELYELNDSTPKGNLQSLWDAFHTDCDDDDDDVVLNDDYALVMFSDTVARRGSSNGQKLAQFIRTNYLGDIVESPARKNPKTGNSIRIWVWAPSRLGMAKMFGEKVEK